MRKVDFEREWSGLSGRESAAFQLGFSEAAAHAEREHHNRMEVLQATAETHVQPCRRIDRGAGAMGADHAE